MILHCLILMIAAFTSPICGGGMDSLEFESFLEKACFRKNEITGVPYVNGQEHPLASTLENFIALVEKFELANPTKSLKDELFYFIRNYTYTNIEYTSLGDIQPWKPASSNYDDIDKMWEPDDNKRKEWPSVLDPFTDAEKCSLFFMISHSIVRKAQKISEQRAPPVMQNSTKNQKWGTEIAFNDDDNYPQEQGVVAIRGTNEAVSLGRVLTGMYVGLRENRKVELRTFTRIPEAKIPTQGTVVDPLYILTIAEVIAISSWRPEVGQRQYLALNGFWKSVPVGSDIDTKGVCPMIYRQPDATENAYSYSSMRGAADGLILGKIIHDLEKRKSDAKLSQVLRQYYNRGGLIGKVPDLGMDIRATFCNREYLLSEWQTMIEEQVRLFVILASQTYGKLEDSISFAMSKYRAAILDKVFQNNDPDLKNYCGVDVTLDKPAELPLETPLDIFAVLKNDASEEHFRRQQLILGSLAESLQKSHPGSRMTIFTDQKSTTPSVTFPATIKDPIYLKTIVEDTYSACAACYVTQSAQDASNKVDEDKIILALNQYLIAKKENESELAGSNGKVIVLFNFDDDIQKNRLTLLKEAKRQLFLEHPDVLIYAVGKNIDVLKEYSKSDSYFVINAFEPADAIETGKTLYEKVKSAPAQLQNPGCKDGKRDVILTDYVSPNAIQHWKFPATYFSASYKEANFTIESAYGNIMVCHSRSTNAPEILKSTCRIIDAKKSEKIPLVNSTNPIPLCEGADKRTCAPFYFSFIGINATDESDKDYCDDRNKENKCKTLDQIQFKISYEGVRCGSMGLIATPFFVLVAILFSNLLSKLV